MTIDEHLMYSGWNDISQGKSTGSTFHIWNLNLKNILYINLIFSLSLQEMLVFLFQEGPFTRGIFRRSAGAKACRELRDKLDSGIQVVPMSRQSVFVIAAVLKVGVVPVI